MLALKVGSHGKDSNHNSDVALKLNSVNDSFRTSLWAQMGASLYLVTKRSQSKTGSMLLGTPPHSIPRNMALIPRCLEHHTSCSVAAPIAEAFRLALAAAEAAMHVLTRKASCNTQHLEGGKTALIVTGTRPLGKGWYLSDGGDVSLCLLFPAPSWSFYSQGPHEEMTHFQTCALVQLRQPGEIPLRLLTIPAPFLPPHPSQALGSTQPLHRDKFGVKRSFSNHGNVRWARTLGSASALWPFPRNHAQGLQQEQQHPESPFNEPPNSQHQRMKGWGRAMITTHYERIFHLTNKIFHGFSFRRAHPKNTHHVIWCNAQISRNTPNAQREIHRQVWQRHRGAACQEGEPFPWSDRQHKPPNHPLFTQ